MENIFLNVFLQFGSVNREDEVAVLGAVQHTLVADGEFAVEAALHHIAEAVLEGRNLHKVADFVGEGKHQQLAGTLLTNAAGTEVVERFIIQLAHRGPVTTLHIVGVDFQERLGVDFGLVGEQDIAVRLEGTRAL